LGAAVEVTTGVEARSRQAPVRRVLKALAWVALAWFALDLLLVVLTSGALSVLPGTRPLGPAAFGLRAFLLGALVVHVWRGDRARLALMILALPTIAQYHFMGRCLSGDSVHYYVQLRSLLKDGDIDLTNEYTHYGLIDQAALRQPTATGLRRTSFAVGPAVLWAPFFLVGEVAGRSLSALGHDVDLTGYGPLHLNAVSLGSLLYGVCAVLLIHDLARRHFRAGVALGAALLAWSATFLHWYMTIQPLMSHTVSAFSAALALYVWARLRAHAGPRGYLLVGLAFGLALCARWQNGVLLSVPAVDLLLRLRSDNWRRSLASAVAMVPGAALGALPQMLAWKALFGTYLLPHPPQGPGFMRLGHPFFLHTLLSSRHGLLSWTPVFWLGFLGLWPLFRRHRALALPLLPALAALTYVNMCAGDWWGGGAFSARRFDSALPILALGFAASLETGRVLVRRHPTGVVVALTAPLLAWGGLSLTQLRRGAVHRDWTTPFPRLVGLNAQLFAEAFGSPPSWPACWLFALRHGRSPAQYDLVAGRYLFYRSANMGGHIDVGTEHDDAMLAEGWGPVERRGEQNLRAVATRARLFAPLDVPETLWIDVRGRPRDRPVSVRVQVNGRESGGFSVDERDAPPYSVRAQASLWRDDLNEVTFAVEGGELLVNSVEFRREAP
jgi:hypothetical protein